MDESIDQKLLNFILTKGSNAEVECQTEEEFPVLKPAVIKELSKIFTRHLCYKVSEKAHQRHTAQLQILNVLRSWCRLEGELGTLPIFQDSGETYKFLLNLLKKYLTEEILWTCEDVKSLVQLAQLLINALTINKSTMKHLAKVIERIVSLDQTEKSKKFLLDIICKSDELELETSVIEKIYLSQKSQFIEKPFTDCFVAFCSDKSNEKLTDNIDIIIAKTVGSPLLFELISNQLKQFFVMTKYAQASQDFIQNILNKIQIQCNKYRKTILDLYPANLQFCVILLRIKPSVHTTKSRNHTVQSLKDIFLKSHNDAIILVSHFPEWLPYYLEFFNISETCETLTQDSDIQIIAEFNVNIN